MSFTRRTVLAGSMAVGAAAATPSFAARPPERIERWGLWEVALEGPRSGNPFIAVQIAAIFESEGRRIRVPGFYDGEGVYRIRFSPPETGRWQWRSESNAAALNRHGGSFEAVAPSPGNHGPVRVSQDGFHFTYADGTAYRQIGTTAYSWALQSDAKCAETLATLKASPFNKIRMLVFPNVPSVATDPFMRTGSGLKDWDPARLDPAYFRRFEDRIRRLGELGIEADVVLFHPYDPKRGYSDMRREDDELYLRYVVARLGAFRHVWWSMANEYDVVKTKTIADWDHLGQLLQAVDPHDRLRSIHQWDLYYDHRKPWITHASIQNNAAVLDDIRAGLHRDFAMKPVIFDEVGYEGNFTEPWGWLTAQQMVERFWFGLIGGTYVGHSETFEPARNAALSWLGQGGRLVGSSMERLAFLRRIMEEGPAPGLDPIQSWWSYRIAGRAGEYYLRYFGSETVSEWPAVLPSGTGSRHGTNPEPGQEAPVRAYRADIVDTWNMTVTPVDGVFNMGPRGEYDLHDPARPVIRLPGRPYLAVRLVRA